MIGIQINTPKIIYVGDPMCSWCYGISEEVNKVKEHFAGAMEFEIVMGGLRPYNTETMSDLKDFLSEHWDQVHAVSGQKFTKEILNNRTITYDTEPPSRAVVVIRHMDATKEIAFLKSIMRAFYVDNKNMHLADSYKDIVSDLKLDFDEFKNLFESEKMKLLVKNDFQRSAELGVRSFPTILLLADGKLSVVVNGYAKSSDMIKRINSLL